MDSVREALQAFADPEYAGFQAKLIPNVPKESFVGVRLPRLRDFAKAFRKMPESRSFLEELPHGTYDENLLHSILLESEKDYGECLRLVDRFLPYVDNWAVCDTLRPKVFAKHREELIPELRRWIASDREYTCRFGLDMLMTHYLEEAFRPEYPALAAAVTGTEYYVRMMVAWYFATALAKQWDAVIPYLEEHRLPEWTHNKTIQKACESYRITLQQKEYLRSLKQSLKQP